MLSCVGWRPLLSPRQVTCHAGLAEGEGGDVCVEEGCMRDVVGVTVCMMWLLESRCINQYDILARAWKWVTYIEGGSEALLSPRLKRHPMPMQAWHVHLSLWSITTRCCNDGSGMRRKQQADRDSGLARALNCYRTWARPYIVRMIDGHGQTHCPCPLACMPARSNVGYLVQMPLNVYLIDVEGS